MADNITLDSGTGGDTLAADDIAGVKFQRIKLISGADGANDGDIASGNPLPVDVISALPAGTNAIGKLAANDGVDIGDVDVTSVPTDPFGADADAASTTGSISAKLRQIATDLNAVVAGSEAQVDVVGALPAGDNNIGNVDIASAIPAGTNNIGDVDVASIAAGANLVGDVGLSGARTSGGTTLYKNIDVDESEDEVKGSAGQVYWLHAMNLSASVLYLKLYDEVGASVTVGTTVPDLTFPLATQGDTNGAGFTLAIPNGIAFGTGITVAATTGIADADSGAPGANAVVVMLGYA